MTEPISGPQRTCLACRSALQKNTLLRFVVAPDGMVTVDYRQKLPGRGAYTCLNMNCIEEAVKKGSFKRAFKGRCQNVSVGLIKEQLKDSVMQKIVNLVGIARKSGQFVVGSNAVLDALAQPKKYCLILMAGDMSVGIAEKLTASAQRKNVPVISFLEKQALGQIFGKEEVSVVAFPANDLAELIMSELDRYAELVREN